MRVGFLVPILFLVPNFWAHANQAESTYIVEIKARDVKERSRIAQIIHIDSVVGDRVFAVVNDHDYRLLIAEPKINMLSVESLGGRSKFGTYYQPFVSELSFPDGDEEFHTFEEMTQVLTDLETKFPALATKFSLGKSVEDRDLWALRLSDDSVLEEKPAIVFMATHHAREHVSTEIPILFAKELLESLATDEELAQLLKEIEIYIIPMVNPDGASYDIRNSRYKWWRKNRKHNHDGSYGVDLNRNYGHGWGTGGSSRTPSSDIYMGTEPFSEPETQAIKEFFLANQNVTIAISFHTFSELVLYPWGGKYDGVGGQDERIFKKMAEDIAEMNHYRPMQSSELYIASGDTCDWLYGELKVYCLTFELSPSSMFGGGFYPGAGIIERVFDDNWEPMIYLANLTKNPSGVLE